MLSKKALAATAGAAAAANLYVEDVFSTWLYTGNGSTQTITNGIDLAGEGGLVWVKTRSGDYSASHQLSDTARGANWVLFTNATNAQFDRPNGCTGFTSTGFTLGTEITHNGTGTNYASWTFRKAEKFFDVVTYTGNGVSGRAISHNLGSAPGCMIVKRTDSASNWVVYHRSLGNSAFIELNGIAGAGSGSSMWNNTTPTSTTFQVNNDNFVNTNGATYVAYLFAHDAGGFGDAGSDSVVSCGSFTSDGSGNATVNLGWEPQWVLIKPSSATGNWWIFDSMRGFVAKGGTDSYLQAHLSNAESIGDILSPSATGFASDNGNLQLNVTYIYIAIRRGPMKTPTDATKVFAAATSAATTGTAISTGFPVDTQILTARSLGQGSHFSDRMRGVVTTPTNANNPHLRSSFTDAEVSIQSNTRNWGNTGFEFPQYWSGNSMAFWSFRRAPGFFDVVAYTGTGFNQVVNHNLGVVPELTIIKRRNVASSFGWYVWAKAVANTSNGKALLNTNEQYFAGDSMWNAIPTSTQLTLGNVSDVSANGGTFIAYLFATCPGVSKVGSYTGTGTTLSIDCGFTNGARFVLIKRTDSTGNWYVWDTARGIVSGNDPYLRLNSNAAEVTNTDYIDPLSSGFQISSTAPGTINANGGSFIFLAIA
jgi:hypothetical protein